MFPDITKAQIVALVQAIIGVLVAFGAPITEAQSVALIALAAVVATVLVREDARIRQARNQRAAIEAASPPVNAAPDEIVTDEANAVALVAGSDDHADAKAEQ